MGNSGQYGPGHTAATTPPRGMRPRLTRLEANAIDAMYHAVLECNAVEPWAPQTDEHPYGLVHKALRAALVDLYGTGHVDTIIEETHNSDGPPSNVVCWHFGIEVEENN